MYCGGGVEYRAARGGALDLGFCGLSGSVGEPFRSSGDECLGRRPAQDALRAGMSLERGPDGRTAASDETAPMAGGNRLASGAVLRPAASKPQRNLLRQAAPRHEAISCLRFGMHCGPRSTLYIGPYLDPSSRTDGGRAESIGVADPQNWADNQAYSARSGILQRTCGGIFAAGKSAVFDARHVSRKASQETQESDWAAPDQAAAGGLVFATP